MSSIVRRIEPMRTASTLGFLRDHCAKCRETTLHKQERCIHCGTIRGTVRAASVDYQGRTVDPVTGRRRTVGK